MDVLTLYVGQGALSAVRAGAEAVIVDSHMPDVEDVTQEHIEQTLAAYLHRSTVRGLILTGFDKDHAHAAGIDSILAHHQPNWVMYPTYYKDTDTASEVFDIINRHQKCRERTSRPLVRQSVRLDKLDSRELTGLAASLHFELFSPHIEDMDCSNNASVVVKMTGRDPAGFTYLVTGDTETERWERINDFFGASLESDVMAAPHHGSHTGVNAQTLLHVRPNTVLISAGVNNQYQHPDPSAVRAYNSVAKHVYTTNAPPAGTCLFTRMVRDDFETIPVRHAELPGGA